MAVIYIDNKPYEVDEGKNLLETCLGLGFDIPYFCWHHALGSVGACRQCAVKKYKDENDKKGKIVMSCMEPVVDGLRISIDDPEARDFREKVIELLMANHPHDCPVCDEGGECHLQDMTLLTGHSYRRYRFKKRTHVNQYMGPFINHEMNRCIQCYRCVRFYRDYAGGTDLDVFSSHDSVYFGRHEEGVLQNEFSGNLVEVCPTGVFTDNTFKDHYTRKWDLQGSPSLCVHCGLGCNIIPGERYGTIRRIRNRYNGTVNGYFLCDRGRYGYGFLNSARRIREIKISSLKSSSEAPDRNAAIAQIKEITGRGNVLGIGSPRASLESNYMLRKLVGDDNFYSGMNDSEHNLAAYAMAIMSETGIHVPSMRETEKADAVLILGEDVLNTAPMLALSLRQTLRNSSLDIIQKNKISLWDDGAVRNAVKGQDADFFVITPYSTGLDGAASRVVHASPEKIAGLGFALAEYITGGKDIRQKLNDAEKNQVANIAERLMKASNPLIVSGTGCGNSRILAAAREIVRGLEGAGRRPMIFLTVPECNTAGAALLAGKSLEKAFADAGKANTVIILENDLYRRAEKKKADKFLASFKHIICIDSIENATTEKAEIVLPSASFAESDGTLVNNETRAQRFYRTMLPEKEIRPGWQWLSEIMPAQEHGDPVLWKNPDDIIKSLASEIPVFSELVNLAPAADYRIAGQKIPRESSRYSGRTAMNANTELHERKPPDDNDSPLAFSMEGYRGQPPAALISFFHAPGWNSVQSVNKYQSSIGGSIAGGDPGRRLAVSSAVFKYEAGAMTKDAGSPEKGLRIVPYYHIFGSEELSALSYPVTERMQKPRLVMSPADANRAGVADNADVLLKVSGMDIRMPVKIDKGMAEGVLGYPLGMPGAAFIGLPAWGEVVKAG